MRYARVFVLVSLIVAAFGCHTFLRVKPDYREMPVDAMRAVALEIEQAIQQGNREASIADRDGIVVNTEAIRHAIRTRAARNELLQQFLDNGYGMEMRSGLVSIDRGADYKKDTTRRQRDRNALLVMSENDDRWTLYEGILDASNISQKSLSAVQLIFFEARLTCMRDGQKYEDEEGKCAFVGGAAKPAAAEK